MTRGIRKIGEFDFTIWFEDGARIQWKSSRSHPNDAIAAAIRKYLLPVAEHIEKARADDAVRRTLDQPDGSARDKSI